MIGSLVVIGLICRMGWWREGGVVLRLRVSGDWLIETRRGGSFCRRCGHCFAFIMAEQVLLYK
jgi:hypothetical protein